MENYFQLYSRFVEKTEPPPNYHAWSSVGAISALIGKKCLIPYGSFNVFPNLYIILVGEPGLKKSSAMNVAKKLVKSVEAVRMAADSGSREGLMDDMVKSKVEIAGAAPYWQSAIFVDEVGDLLGGDHLDAGMVRFLTTIWDQLHYKEVTRKGGSVAIQNPYLTLLGCCPTKWMDTKLREDVITGGLSRRTIFALEHRSGTLNPRPPTPDYRIKAQLETEAKRMFELKGEYHLSTKAWAVFDQFYLATNTALHEYAENMQSYYSSKHMLVLKLAMCLSAGVSNTRLISSQMIKTALAFLAQSEKHLATVFAGVGRNVLKGFSEKILDDIKAASGKGGLSKAEILRKYFRDVDGEEISRILEYLQNSKLVTLKSKAAIVNSPDEMRFVAEGVVEVLPDVDLLELVRQLEPCSEEIREDSSPSEPTRHLDPATQRLLAHQDSYRRQTSSGLLLRGTPSPTSAELESLSSSPDGSPDS